MAGELYTAIRATTGSVASGTPATTDAQLLIFLNEASQFVTHSLPLELAVPFYTDSSGITSSAGYTVVSDRVVSARRNGRFCRKVDLLFAYAQDLVPTFTIVVSDYANIAAGLAITIDGIKLYCQASATAERSDFIKETSSAATAQNIVDAITNTFSAPISASLSTATITITGAKSVTSQDATRLTVTSTSVSNSLMAGTALFPIYYIQANKLYVKPDPSASAIGYVTYVSPITFSTGSDSEVTVSGVRTIILDYATYLDFTHISGVWRDLAQTEIAKATVATTGYLADFEGALPTWINVTAPNLPVLSLDSMTTLPTLTLSTATDTWPTFSETINLPVLTLSSMTALPTEGMSGITLTLPSAPNLPVLTLTGAPEFTDLDLSGISIPSSSLIYTSGGDEPGATITLTQSLPTFNMPVCEVDISTYNTYMGTSTDDIEKASVEIQKQSTLINKFQVDAQNELQRFNGEIASYRAELEKEIAEIQANTSTYGVKLQDNRNQLDQQIQQYNLDLNKYQQQVNAAVQEWLAEQVQFGLAKWQSQVQSEISEFSANSNAIIGEYSAEVQAVVQEAQFGLSREKEEYSQLVQAYINEYQAKTNAEIQAFGALVTSVIQEYANKLQSYQAKVQAYLGQLQALRNSELSEFSNKVQAYINEYTAKNNAKIAEYNSTSQTIISEYSALVNNEAQKFSAGMNKAMSYLQEIASVVSIAGVYISKSQISFQNGKDFYEKALTGLKVYISKLEGKNVNS